MRRLLPLVFLFLAGCSDAPPLRAVEATSDRLALTFAGDHLTEARRDAALYCANLGRSAVLREVSEHGDVTTAAFDCR